MRHTWFHSSTWPFTENPSILIEYAHIRWQLFTLAACFLVACFNISIANLGKLIFFLYDSESKYCYTDDYLKNYLKNLTVLLDILLPLL